MGVFVSSCMVGICSLFDGCSLFPCSSEKGEKKTVVYFRMLNFSSTNAATRRVLQTARLKSHIQSCFSSQNVGVTDCGSCVYDGKHIHWR